MCKTRFVIAALTAGLASLALPQAASAKVWFYCFVKDVDDRSEPLLILTTIMEADVDSIDEHRLEMAWSRHLDETRYPSVEQDRGGRRFGCSTAYIRAGLEDEYRTHYLSKYAGETVTWGAVPTDIVPKARVIEGVEIVADAGGGVEKATPDPAGEATGTAPKTNWAAEWARRQAEHAAQLAEHQRQLDERERLIAEAAAKHAANKAAADAAKAQHEREMAAHRDQVAAAERAAAQYRTALAVQKMTSPPSKKDDEPVEFKEGIVLCLPPAKTTNSFFCQGPLQNVSTKLNTPDANARLGEACGSDRSIRDLGMVSGYRAFGCGFGIHPTASDYPGNRDVPAKMGIDYIPGRASFYCLKSKLAYCRG